jgi:quercetin dioxygenase-like cupin family protein
MPMLPRQVVRRVVTGVDASGASVVVSDGPCECQAVEPQSVSVDLWSTGVPAATDGPIDVPAVADLDAAPGEVIWRRFTLAPGERIAFHSTETLDLMTVLSGRITMLMEKGPEVVLEPGDCIVQRGTVHGWFNQGAEPCVLIGVMACTRGEG